MRFPDAGPVELGVGGYLLRAPRLEDADGIEVGLNDFEVARMLARVPHPFPRGTAAGWIEMAEARRANGVGLDFVIAGEEPVGAVGFAWREGEAELGYWLARPAWGRGVMTAAVRAALALAFGFGAETVVSGAFADNPASLRVQEKLGFEITGETRIYALSRKARLRHIDTRLSRDSFLETVQDLT